MSRSGAQPLPCLGEIIARNDLAGFPKFCHLRSFGTTPFYLRTEQAQALALH